MKFISGKKNALLILFILKSFLSNTQYTLKY